MKKTENLNNPACYRCMEFNLGFDPGHVMNDSVFRARKNEEVSRSVLPYISVNMEELERKYDQVNFAVVEEIARSRYLTALQIYQFVNLRGLKVSMGEIWDRLIRMLRQRVIRKYELNTPDDSIGLSVFDLDHRGFQIALRRGVAFHKGNMYISSYRKNALGLTDSPEEIRRVLAGNAIVLGNLMNGAAFERFGIMETMRPSDCLQAADGCIIRTAANLLLDDESFLLYEVVRNTPEAVAKLEDKVGRYYTLLHDSRYLEDNYYGYRALPQLVICGENYEHCLEVDRHLRSRGLIREEDSILYTEDRFYRQETLQNLYELDEEGRPAWYSLPSVKKDGNLKPGA